MAAIRAVTVNAAFQNFEEDRKGSLETGKVADLVVLSANPLEVHPEALADIVVEETFSRGRSIYRREPSSGTMSSTVIRSRGVHLDLTSLHLVGSTNLHPGLLPDGTLRVTSPAERSDEPRLTLRQPQ